MNRRCFLGTGAALICGALCSNALLPLGSSSEAWADEVRGRIFRNDAPSELWQWSRKADFAKQVGNQRVLCTLCPNACLLSPNDRSVCRNRVNKDGTLYTLAYGNPCAVHIDPIEKKPLFHFLPTSTALSIATTGCNLRCLNCQNWQISQSEPGEVRHESLFPQDAVRRAAVRARSIAYTYSEPISFFEYMSETARLAMDQGLSNLLISNGYINQTPLKQLCSRIQAANINLKSFSDDIYRSLNGGRLDPVLETLKTLHEQGVHLEITNLVVPGYTDNEEMFRRMCGWILEHLGPDRPLHLLRFFPRYKLNRVRPTPVPLLQSFRKLAMQEGMHYVYIGNAPVEEGQNTSCHHCGALAVKRRGYSIQVVGLDGSVCRDCGRTIPGVWS
jgi:pyruvate formate lyase activating enzyme